MRLYISFEVAVSMGSVCPLGNILEYASVNG